MSKKLTISFKETKKDTELLMSIKNLEEISQTIKEILYKALVEKREFK